MAKNGAGYDPDVEDVPTDFADEGESELNEKDLEQEEEFNIENVSVRKQPQQIIVPFSEEDIQDLMSGEELNWVFKTQDGTDIELVLRQEREEDLIGME